MERAEANVRMVRRTDRKILSWRSRAGASVGAERAHGGIGFTFTAKVHPPDSSTKIRRTRLATSYLRAGGPFGVPLRWVARSLTPKSGPGILRVALAALSTDHYSREDISQRGAASSHRGRMVEGGLEGLQMPSRVVRRPPATEWLGTGFVVAVVGVEPPLDCPGRELQGLAPHLGRDRFEVELVGHPGAARRAISASSAGENSCS